jgi:hypothetical protein
MLPGSAVATVGMKLSEETAMELACEGLLHMVTEDCSATRAERLSWMEMQSAACCDLEHYCQEEDPSLDGMDQMELRLELETLAKHGPQCVCAEL